MFLLLQYRSEVLARVLYLLSMFKPRCTKNDKIILQQQMQAIVMMLVGAGYSMLRIAMERNEERKNSKEEYKEQRKLCETSRCGSLLVVPP